MIEAMSLCCAAGKMSGDVRISGHPKEQKSFARISGYVEQFDIVSLKTLASKNLLNSQ